MSARTPHRSIIDTACREFEHLAGEVAGHRAVEKESVYPQPHTYLTSHLVCMRAAGWSEPDFDTLTAVSGAAALFAYEPGTFRPKYALLHIGIDERIADATGFGWEWTGIETAESAWEIVRHAIDAGQVLKGWAGENVVFAGYEETGTPEERRVYVLTDGGEYFIDWWSWLEFSSWATEWSQQVIGRHTRRVATQSAGEIAARVLRDTVAWADEPPAAVRRQYPQATFGLAGIAAYADDCADIRTHPNWHVCHDVNPQWTVRGSTATYLERLVDGGVTNAAHHEALRSAAAHYRAAYAAWRELYRQLGPAAPRSAGGDPVIRAQGAAAVRKALDHEQEAIRTLRDVVEALDA